MDKIVTKQKVYGLDGKEEQGVDYCAEGDRSDEEGCEKETFSKGKE